MKICFRARGEADRIVIAFGGLTLMEAAVQGGIDEIEAQCGGACACATCHVYIPDDWRSITGEANEMERELLDAADAVTPNSRLSCQIELKGNMDGLVVELPPSSASA